MRKRDSRFLVCLALLLALAAAAFGEIPTTHRTAAPTADKPLASPALDANEYLRIVSDLSDDSMEGRGAGTKGIEKARDYLVEQLKAAGLKPAFGESFVQPFEIPLGLTVDTQSLKILESLGKEIYDARAGQDFAAMGYSPKGRFAGKPVLVGYGIKNPKAKYDSYGHTNRNMFKGKVIIAFRFEPQDSRGRSLWSRGGQDAQWSQSASLINKAKWAAERGAVALLVVNPPSQDKDKELKSSDYAGYRARVKIPVVHITSEMFRRILRAAGAQAGEQRVRELQKRADRGTDRPKTLEEIVLKGEITVKRSRATLDNVAAVLEGAGELTGEVVVVGAHYDHLGYGGFGSRWPKRAIHPGADDNASGTAGVVLLARLFHERVARGAAPPLRRTLVFVAFSGEERGLLGSRYMVRHLDEWGVKAEKLVAAVNIDMIGRLRRNRLYALAADSGDRWRDILKRARQASKLDIRTPSGVGGGGDHASFYRVTKTPVLHIFTGVHGDYHKPSDTADKIDSAGAVKILKAVEAMIEELWTRTDRIAYVPPKGARLASRRAYLGIIRDPTVEGAKGFAIMSVAAAGPADRAGIQGGDVIVRWNDKPITGLRSLLDALGASRPGQKVKITINRDGRRMQLEVTLGRRSQ